MAGRIFLLNDRAELVAMQESPYDSEALLQELLATHPDLLAGDQISVDEPRRWLLVMREMGVPDEDQGNSRWSLDHLFLDQDGVPTLVEVKRSSDTRIRREVVGQMLDYAANAIAYWPAEEIRAKFEARCQQDSVSADETMTQFLGDGRTPDEFWHQVKTNLQAGRIRLVFLADDIPAELRRVVEFLNSQMDPAEVLAVEIKQYTGQGMQTLVPRVLGLTETARQKKAGVRHPERQWDEESFFAELRLAQGEAAAEVARKCLDWAIARNLSVWWGRGQSDGSFVVWYANERGRNFLFAVWTRGRFDVQFQFMRLPPFTGLAKRRELAAKLEEIPGLVVTEAKLAGRPAFSLELLAEPSHLRRFLDAFDWVVDQLRQADPPTI